MFLPTNNHTIISKSYPQLFVKKSVVSPPAFPVLFLTMTFSVVSINVPTAQTLRSTIFVKEG